MLIEPTDSTLDVSWHRLAYDHQTSLETTIAAGMPEYGAALASGIWPSQDILPESERQQSGQPLNLPPIQI